jgi:hypothetical protein
MEIYLVKLASGIPGHGAKIAENLAWYGRKYGRTIEILSVFDDYVTVLCGHNFPADYHKHAGRAVAAHDVTMASLKTSNGELFRWEKIE